MPSRPLGPTRFPYVYVDATYRKTRMNHQFVFQAVVIATGMTEVAATVSAQSPSSRRRCDIPMFRRSLRVRAAAGCTP
ncbi:transposase [Streptomyces chiangmaiensis]